MFVRITTLVLILCLGTLLNATTLLQLKTANLAIYADQPLTANQSSAMQALDAKIDRLQMETGVYEDAKAPIFMVADHNSYQALALGKAKIVEFSDAFYSGSEQRIYIRPQAELSESYQKILMHEYIHWYLERIFSGAPLWFHEGMATYYSGQLGFERYLYFLQQSFFGRSSDLFRLGTGYPQRQEDWQIFYLSSSMAVRYMSAKKPAQWKTFWDICAYHHRQGQKAPFSTCFIQAYNQSLYDFHREFSAYTKRLRFQYLFWGFNAFLAVLLPFVVLIGYQRRRRKLAQMKDTELEPQPAIPEWVSNHTPIDTINPNKENYMPRKVLILCTGNSCRSIMAEALINHTLGDTWQAFSAGVNPSSVNPRAIAVLMEIGIDISNYRSKSVTEFLESTDLDLVITVCDHAKETCPVFLNPVKQVHLGIPDPAPWTNEPDETALPMFRDTINQIQETLIPFLRNYP